MIALLLIICCRILGNGFCNRDNDKKMQMTPVLIYSAKDFSPKEKTQLKQYANRILLKDVNSLELLLEEAVMHLHINHKDLLPEKRKMIENLRSKKMY